MKTKVVRDSFYKEKKYNLLCKISTITEFGSLDNEIVKAREELETKKSQVEYVKNFPAINSEMYFDINLGESFYDVIAVGDYGMGIIGDTDNTLFSRYNRIYELNTLDDLTVLKPPLLTKLGGKYTQFVLTHMREPDPYEDVNISTIVYEQFINSSVWKSLAVKRRMIAESRNVMPGDVFRLLDVIDLLNAMPSAPSPTCHIFKEYQKLIIKEWKEWVYMDA